MDTEFREKRLGPSGLRMPPLPAGHHLEAFLCVVEEGAFSAAARSLNLAQSTLSRQMKQLEDALGCTLFIRTPNGTQLTAAGEVVYGYARRSLAELGEVRRRIAEARHGQHLRIASVSGPLYTILPPMLNRFEQRHALRVVVREAATDEVAELVRLRRADLGILNLPVGEGLLIEPLVKSELALVMPKGHPLARQRRVELQDVRDEPFILLTEDQALNRLAVSACHAHGFAPRVTHYTRDIHLCIHLVGQGCGMSIVPRTGPVTRLSPSVHFVRIRPPLRRTLAIVYLEATPLLGDLIPYLKDAFQAFGR